MGGDLAAEGNQGIFGMPLISKRCEFRILNSGVRGPVNPKLHEFCEVREEEFRKDGKNSDRAVGC